MLQESNISTYAQRTISRHLTNKFGSRLENEYIAKPTKTNSLIRHDFMPLFDDKREEFDESKEAFNYIGHHYDPSETLFRHSFNKYRPNVHKYITSNIKI